MTFRIRAAERRDVQELLHLAEAQALARRARNPFLPLAPQTVPFMSRAESLADALTAHWHAAFVAERDSALVGGVNLHRIVQRDEDEFASYYPRRFTALGLLATAPDALDALAPLVARAAEQAAQWRAPSLLFHHPSAARDASSGESPSARGAQIASATRPAAPGEKLAPRDSGALEGERLRVLGFRTYYHYALRPPGAPFATAPGAVAGVSVRRATPADLDDAVRIGIESVHFHAACEPTMQPARSEPRKMRVRFETILRETGDATLLVAVRQEQVIGFGSIYSQQIDEQWTPPLFAAGRYGLIAEVAVDVNERHRGVGRQLFAAMDSWFREGGVAAYWLIYLPHNPLSSRFWSALEFAPVWDVLLLDRS